MDISKSDSFFILKKITSYVNKNISHKKMVDLLNAHPHRGDMKAISDNLDSLGIENGVYKLEKEQIYDLEAPFVAHIHNNGGEFIWVNQIKNNSVQILKKDKSYIEADAQLFMENWSGHALFFNETIFPFKHEKGIYLKNIMFWIERHAWLMSMAVLFVLLAGCFWAMDFPKERIAWAGIKLAGLVVSGIILYKTHQNSAFLKRICKIGQKIDCNAVLNSKAAKLFGKIGLGELALLYFLITLIFPGNISPLSYGLSSIAFLFTLFTIAYQWLVAQK